MMRGFSIPLPVLGYRPPRLPKLTLKGLAPKGGKAP